MYVAKESDVSGAEGEELVEVGAQAQHSAESEVLGVKI